MCGRYAFAATSEFDERYSLEKRDFKLFSSFNVTPGQNMPVIIRSSPKKAILMKWGLIPFWAQDPKIGYKMINARAETVTSKPSFKKSFSSKRCLIPTIGFYEWSRISQVKQPFFIRVKSTHLFSFAGIFDIWKDAENNEIYSYAIITTTPNSTIDKIHNRMPVILQRENENYWLAPDTPVNSLLQFLAPYPASDTVMYPVNSAVNNPENDNKDLLNPI